MFSEMTRTDLGPKLHEEPDFEYLDRSARSEAECIRAVMSDWLRFYPEGAARDVVSRIKSPNDSQHKSAGFELYLHELLRRLGYTVKVHPRCNTGRTTVPDFLAISSDGLPLYVEAVQSSDASEAVTGAERRLATVLDYLNQLQSTHFFIGIHYDSLPAQSPPLKRMRHELAEWLASLDADRIISEVRDGGHDALPELRSNFGGWEVTFTAIPRSPEKRAAPTDRIIGAVNLGARSLNTWEVVRDSLVSKGKRYGDLGHPFIIAVNADVDHMDNIDVMEALFGQEQFISLTAPDSTEPHVERARNGFWYGRRGTQYSRVSGVLIGFDVKPWTYGVRELNLYLNPWARYPINGPILQMSRFVPVEDKMERQLGLHPAEVVSLPTCYPGVERRYQR